MVITTKEIDLDELIENLEKLNHFLLYKNRNFCRKHLSKIIANLKKEMNQ